MLPSGRTNIWLLYDKEPSYVEEITIGVVTRRNGTLFASELDFKMNQYPK
jgi:hypothetical protein